MRKYEPKQIEPKWQQVWADTKLYAAITGDKTREKYYMLTEFPYPSGAGLHAGHAREYILGDVIARHKRMQGFNVLYPMGYDAFGLPTENYAIKHKIAPEVATAENIATFRGQFDSLGFSFDWDREVNTTDPKYYRWTQWLFLRFLDAGLAYQAEMAINWCPFEKTGLANEEVVDGKHERCGTPVEKKLIKQWMLKITAYADRLIDGLKTVDYPPRIADQQINWIGRSEGAEITWALDMDIPGAEQKPVVTVYTTRPDTLFGATFLVVSPELAATWKQHWDAPRPVQDYIDKALKSSELDRQEDNVKTGVDTGLSAVHPLTGKHVPVWVADYVLGGYGTGAIMAVPAHDDRDLAFAKTFNLPITPVVVAPSNGKTALILHGTGSHNQEHWIPWLKASLESFGYEVIAPNLPNSEFPDLEAWQEALAPYVKKMTKESIIIAHSLGGPTAEHFIARNKLKIAQLLLVAPTFPDMPWSSYPKEYFQSNGQNIHDVTNVPVDRSIITKSVGRITVFGSDDDPYVPFDLLKKHVNSNLPGATFIGFKNLGHFSARTSGLTALPAALNYLITTTYTGQGKLINSGEFNDQSSVDAKRSIVKALEQTGAGKPSVKYKLRDWIFSRQHYWGEPIPVVHCRHDGAVAVPTDQLPVTLPQVKHYEPSETGESPLAGIPEWVNTTCPKCGGPARRETDTMPNWAGSSWYYLRYMDARNSEVFASSDALSYWKMPDLYLGGMEHTTLHLLYSRFWHQFLYDQGLVPTPEPYASRRGQGIVLAADGRKMSKSVGNVVNPTDIIATHGADTLRLYILFMAPYDETTPWSEERLGGASRFVYKVWNLAQELMDAHAFTRDMKPQRADAFETLVDRTTHKTIKKVHDELGGMRFNTAISGLMEYVNFLTEPKTKGTLLEAPSAALSWRVINTLVQLMAPFTPHMTEELWKQLGWEGSVHVSGWPEYDPEIIKDDVITIVVQVNGRLRANVAMPAAATEAELTAAAKADPNVAKYLDGTIVKTIVVPRKLVNFVVK
jgi:leucyl-tRNA synthetase